jgi:hypothetical protein
MIPSRWLKATKCWRAITSPSCGSLTYEMASAPTGGTLSIPCLVSRDFGRVFMKPDLDISFLAGGGEMGARTRAMDWSGTAVGSPAKWSQSLKAAVSICLGSRHPIVVWWGRPDYTQFYNDAYISILGNEKRPSYLGRSGRECWSEIWPIMGPMLEEVFRTGQATWSEDFLYVLNAIFHARKVTSRFRIVRFAMTTDRLVGFFARAVKPRAVSSVRDVSRRSMTSAEWKQMRKRPKILARSQRGRSVRIPTTFHLLSSTCSIRMACRPT